MADILDGILNDTLDLLLLGVVVMAVLFVIMTWVRTRSLVPTLGAVVLGSVVIFGVNNMESGGTVGDAIEEDIDRRSD